MRAYFPGLVLLIAVLQVVVARGEDGLFSDVSAGSVFSSGEIPRDVRAVEPRPQALPAESGADAIAHALLIGGFQPRPLSDKVVGIDLDLEGFSAPVLLTISADAKQLWLVMLLSTVDEPLASEKLLKLMSAGRQYAPTYFTFNEQRRRIELYSVLTLPELSGERIRAELENLVKIARETEKLWDVGSRVRSATAAGPASEPPAAEAAPVAAAPQPAAPSVPAPKAATPAPTSPASTLTPLVGRWSATVSKTEAFAMLLKGDGNFVLVHVKDGKQTKSTGAASLAAGKLTLSSAKAQLAGTIQLKTADEFQFLPTGAKQGLQFKRAK